MRYGLLTFGGTVELQPIDLASMFPMEVETVAVEDTQGSTLAEEDVSLPVIDVFADNEVDAAIATLGAQEAPVSAPLDSWELDWQISLIPINVKPPSELPQFAPPTLF